MSATLTMLIHGESGVGKSWLTDTVPPPRLILDTEGRAKYTPSGPKIAWSPQTEAPPQYDGTWQTCVVNVLDFATLDLVWQWLRSGQHNFRSIGIDSLMELQKRLIDATVGDNALQQQDWGVILRRLEQKIRDFRDLVLLPGAVDCVVMTAGSKNDNGVMRPLLQGQICLTLPYYLDTVGYLFIAADTDGNMRRQMLVAPTTGVVAKDGTGRLANALGAVIPDPDITQLFQYLNGEAG